MAVEAPVRPEVTPAADQPRDKRTRRRWTRSLVGWSALVLILGVGTAWLLSWSSPVPVRELRIVGASEETEQEILRLVDVRLGEAIRDHDPALMTQRVSEMPGVMGVEVALQRPWTIVVSVDERFPFAQYERDGQYTIVDDRGEIIRTASQPMKRLPALGTQENMESLLEPLRAAPEGLLAKIGAVGRNETGLVLLLRNGGVVLLGDTGALDAKYATLQSLLPTKAKTFNLTVPERPALTGELTLPKRNRIEQQGESPGVG